MPKQLCDFIAHTISNEIKKQVKMSLADAGGLAVEGVVVCPLDGRYRWFESR
jgi:hypothetical protein